MTISDEISGRSVIEQIIIGLENPWHLNLLCSLGNDELSNPVMILSDDPTRKNILEATLKWMRNYSSWCRFIDDFVITFESKTDPERNYYFGSSQIERHGIVKIINFEFIAHQLDVASAGLIHEAIHQYLFCFEKKFQSFISFDLASSKEKIRSPWTGNELYTVNVCHAAFVWYTLYLYWFELSKNIELTNRHPFYEEQRRKIRTAFFSSDFEDTIQFFISHEETNATNILTTIRERFHD